MIISEQNPTPRVIDRKNPVPVTLKTKQLLTKQGSTKQTYHLSLNIANSGLQFKVGDSLGIYPENHPLLVERLIQAMQRNPEEMIQDPRTQTPLTLRQFLTHKANLSRLTSSFLKLFSHDKLIHLLQEENKPLLSEYLNTHDPLDFFTEFPGADLSSQAICTQFCPLLPRFYSVASSQNHLEDEVHLTVALSTFTHREELRYGVGTHFLCHLAQENTTPIYAYVQPAAHFTLPKDDTAPIIMIGPGTGVAPFRAFLQERAARHAQGGPKGRNWLFFGERNRSTDFLYEEEWIQAVAEGRLRLDCVFSRDQPEKLYVQHQMYTHRKELWDWLEQGAYFYVCGDAQYMAKDVDKMLHILISEEGNKTEEEAKAYVKALKSGKRYLTDVY